jgi:hypothetical protein
MNDIEGLQYGLSQGLHKKEGWLWKCLKADGIVQDTMEALRERCYDAYQAQKFFIMAQKQVMPEGWDPINPCHSVKKQKGTGKFVSLQKIKNPVPANVLTASFLCFAFGISKETFRRWMGEGRNFVKRVLFNKGENVIDDPKMAATYFTPRKLFMQHEMQAFKDSPEGSHASLKERQAHRLFLKEKFKDIPSDIMDVYKKAAREKMAQHGFIEESIVDTLNDNNEQSFRSLSKHVSRWCSYQTIERRLKKHESYASYSKNIKPGLTEGNRVKQVNFSKRVHDRWGLPAHTNILWCMSDEKWWFGLIARTFAKMCPELGIEKKSFSAHHKSHINKV